MYALHTCSSKHCVPSFLSLSLYQMVPGGGGVPTMQRIPLPGAEMLEEEPLYVNAKQYHRILKRRQARAKLEAEGKIPKERRVRPVVKRFLSSPATHLFHAGFILHVILLCESRSPYGGFGESQNNELKAG